jgi:hypothetical protein
VAWFGTAEAVPFQSTLIAFKKALIKAQVLNRFG